MKTSKKLQNKRNFRERREQIYKLIKEVGLWNVDKKALAEHFGVSLKTIYNDIEAIVKHVDIDEINTIRFALHIDLKKAEQELREILRDKEASKGLKLRAVATLINLVEKYTRFLEDFGLKEKAIEKIEIEATTLKTLEELYKEHYGD